VGDMEGTLDAWVLVLSFSISLITALVGTYSMIDQPYTAQVRTRACALVGGGTARAPGSASKGSWQRRLSACAAGLAVGDVQQLLHPPCCCPWCRLVLTPPPGTRLQGDFRWYLMLSIFWSVYNMIPPSLFIFYCYNKGQMFEDFCSFCLTLSFIMGIGGITCTWLVPDDYNLGQVGVGVCVCGGGCWVQGLAGCWVVGACGSPRNQCSLMTCPAAAARQDTASPATTLLLTSPHPPLPSLPPCRC